MFQRFDAKLVAFLRALDRNNDKKWFQANKDRFSAEVQEPMLAFVEALAPRIRQISKHIVVEAKKSGGSLSRIFRDTRFSKDKSPYKTYTGVQFRHAAGKDAHAPGFYLHLQPRGVFTGVGIWHPDSSTLAKIRSAIVDDPDGWRDTIGGTAFRQRYELQGDSLKRPPRGFPADHPLIEDLKRKDFIAIQRMSQKVVTGGGFLERFADDCAAGSGLVEFLCDAIGVAF